MTAITMLEFKRGKIYYAIKKGKKKHGGGRGRKSTRNGGEIQNSNARNSATLEKSPQTMKGESDQFSERGKGARDYHKGNKVDLPSRPYPRFVKRHNTHRKHGETDHSQSRGVKGRQYSQKKRIEQVWGKRDLTFDERGRIYERKLRYQEKGGGGGRPMKETVC